MIWLGLAVLLILLATSCKRNHGAPQNQPTDSPGASEQLPPIELKSDTRGLLLTWVDSQGDFHVTESIKDVPAPNRAEVRVVLTDKTAGTGDRVYVADLRNQRADGSYPVQSWTRDRWDELGASRRKARLEALAPLPDAGAAAPNDVQAPQKEVVIYGADWCGACKQAARYLKHKGIKFLEKDVDRSPTIQAELKDKLRRAGMSATSSIPVIDIGGRLLVGFNAAAVDAALVAANQPPPTP